MNFSSISTQNLLFILLALGALYMVYTTIRDLVKKKNEKDADTNDATPAPAASHPAYAPAPGGADNKILPLQLQAYERLVLLIERLTPQSLMNRVYGPDMSAIDMQVALVQTIKAEFDHNITQQIYVSAGAWDAAKTVKDQTIAMINQVAVRLPEGATAMDLNKALLEIYMQFPESPSDLAAKIISGEAKRIMQ